jgi:glycosyltransferase involved in cell wall biosynthesis
MRIGIDASCWRNNRGFGRFTRELLSAIFAQPRGHQFIVFSDDPEIPDLTRSSVEHVRIEVGRKVIDAAVDSDRRSVGDVLAFTKAAGRKKLDLLFYPAVYSWFPPPLGVPSVVVFHDAIAEHFPDLVFPQRRERTMWNLKCWLAKKTCKRVLTVSQTAKREIVDYLHIPAKKIDVICEGADGVFCKIGAPDQLRAVRDKYGVPRASRMICYVGGFAPHKNLFRLLDAVEIALSEDGCGDLQLVMVGDPGGGGYLSIYKDLQARVGASETLRGHVRFTGYVSDEDLAALFSDSLALALPSLSEGFGLPALEAMACGAPVLAARDGAVMEVAGAAGLAFDPLDAGDMANAIKALATDQSMEQQLRAHAIPETARNTWPRAAELTLDCFESLKGERPCAS